MPIHIQNTEADSRRWAAHSRTKAQARRSDICACAPVGVAVRYTYLQASVTPASMPASTAEWSQRVRRNHNRVRDEGQGAKVRNPAQQSSQGSIEYIPARNTLPSLVNYTINHATSVHCVAAATVKNMPFVRAAHS